MNIQITGMSTHLSDVRRMMLRLAAPESFSPIDYIKTGKKYLPIFNPKNFRDISKLVEATNIVKLYLPWKILAIGLDIKLLNCCQQAKASHCKCRHFRGIRGLMNPAACLKSAFLKPTSPKNSQLEKKSKKSTIR